MRGTRLDVHGAPIEDGEAAKLLVETSLACGLTYDKYMNILDDDPKEIARLLKENECAPTATS